ncbi:cilia- and flagella-associated protein 91 isoform X2 [Boleophthalmus pectinirostris]|uniref:cilia- and flagella-associated protein 91 isoform X2 n=1 Tax=Boleophthalmus pectinirostris TaxID=150288 RepID=UPI0024300927|nr:cilia- and flagella-associated protein 91 isoform X2 [Boleophthalmus pectinirostris]
MSVSNTRTILHKDNATKFVSRERTYDYLYDPVYTVSSEVDHIRTSLKAYTSKDRVLKIPEYGSMFSHLPHYPRFKLQLDPSDPVPATIDRRWRGHAEQYKEALHQLAGVRSASSWLQKEEGHVTGSDRWKYFSRPLIPFGQQLPPDVIFALPKEEFVSSLDQKPIQQPTHFTVAVQTDYRESETQTDPYSPEYIIEPGTTPSELLTLASLTWGHGLPAGLAEVEMIERARAKRAWEATLPPLDDLSQLDKRRRMMEEMEAREWAFREGQIQKLKEARLEVLTDLLKKRDEIQQNYTHDRLKQINHKLQKEKETKINKINNDYFRAMRKLDARHSIAMDKLTHALNFKDYSDLSSHMHPAVRRKHDADKNYYFDTEGFTELETGLSASSLKSTVKSAQQPTRSKIKNSSQRAIQLYEQYMALRRKDTSEEPLECLVKIEKPSPPPVTPEVERPPEGEEEREIAVINLQKLLRGRAIQYELIQGKQNHLDLIRELRSVHALQSEEQALQKAEKDRILNLKRERDQQIRRTEHVEALQARGVDTELEYMFDTLSKELIRLQEERRIHAFTLLAERDRRVREAEESGRRQVEERRRKEDDDIFRQINQESVDLYLEDIILETTETAADEQARKEIHQLAKEVNDVACAMEESRQSEAIVYELVYSFLIPEVVKTSVRQKVQQKQERHLQAARSIIHGPSPPSAQSPSNSVTQDEERVKESEQPHTHTNN